MFVWFPSNIKSPQFGYVKRKRKDKKNATWKAQVKEGQHLLEGFSSYQVHFSAKFFCDDARVLHVYESTAAFKTYFRGERS